RLVRAPPRDDGDVHRLERLLQEALAAPHCGRRHEVLAARQGIRVIVAAVDADELIDLVVVRRDVLVFDRPGDLPAVRVCALEVEIGVAEADAAPDVRLAAVAPDANELERLPLRREVRLVAPGVEEELRLLLSLGLSRARLPRPDVRPVLA